MFSFFSRLHSPLCTAYIKETGDFTILDHPTPFDNVPGSEVPLMEHIRRSVNFTLNNLGPKHLFFGTPRLYRGALSYMLTKIKITYPSSHAPTSVPRIVRVYFNGFFIFQTTFFDHVPK